MFSERNLYGDQPTRRIFRFGQRITGQQLPTAPQRARGVDESVLGRLRSARLRARGREAWLRLRASDLSREVRTIPINSTQAPAPTPDSLELRGGMRVRCHEGYVGRLAGLVVETSDGLVSELIVRVRNDALAEVDLSTDPMFKLVNVQGQNVMVPPTWAVSVTRSPRALPFLSPELTLRLDATVEQIASATLLRSDGELTAAVWQILNENPAIRDYQQQLRVRVRDGEVTLLGTLPSPR
ncbi:MAG: BON domain-containing protein, partial [Chloroflexota bacterium]|nr:BON domain-containing protein [Chloroflexota bacterium]